MMPPRSSELAETHLLVRRLVLYCDRLLPADDDLLRKAVTAQLPNRELLHGHDPTGRPIASYVRYRVEHGRGQITGWGPALSLLSEIRDDLNHIHLARSLHEVLGTELHDNVEPFGLAPYLLTYHSISPWLALNEANHGRFGHLQDPQEKSELLSRIMVGNLLALAKHANHWVEGRIMCEVSPFHETLINHKGVELLGFDVECQVNFYLPEWLGIGKLVSKGYGLFQRTDDELS